MIDQLTYCINSYREAALSSDAKFDHIDLAEKQKVHRSFLVQQLGELVGRRVCKFTFPLFR